MSDKERLLAAAALGVARLRQIELPKLNTDKDFVWAWVRIEYQNKVLSASIDGIDVDPALVQRFLPMNEFAEIDATPERVLARHPVLTDPEDDVRVHSVFRSTVKDSDDFFIGLWAGYRKTPPRKIHG